MSWYRAALPSTEDWHKSDTAGRTLFWCSTQSCVPSMFSCMTETPLLRPAKREDALFAIMRALNTRHGHELAAQIAAEVVLAKIEALNMVIMQRPPGSDPGVTPKR